MKRLLLPLLAFTSLVRAEVTLPAVISDHMVLQARAGAAIWGWAEAGEEVTVSIADQSRATKADAAGKWTVTLAKLEPSSAPRTLTVKGRNTLTVQDVLVGEVWLAAGQSNMEMTIKDKLHGSVDGADEE